MVTTTSKEASSKRAKKQDNTIASLFAKKNAPDITDASEKGTGGVSAGGIPPPEPMKEGTAEQADGGAKEGPPEVGTKPPNETAARQPEHPDDASGARKRKPPPNENPRLQVEPVTQEDEDGKPAAEEDFTLPAGSNFQAPANQQAAGPTGPTFQQMWEEVIAKAPDDRAKTWNTAITELNKAIV